jgi:hypothetical protein
VSGTLIHGHCAPARILIITSVFVGALCALSLADEPVSFGTPQNGVEIGIFAVKRQEYGRVVTTIRIVTKNVGKATLDLMPSRYGAVVIVTESSGKSYPCFQPPIVGSVGMVSGSSYSPNQTPSPEPTPSPTPAPTPTREHMLLPPGARSLDPVGAYACVGEAGPGNYWVHVTATLFRAGAIPGTPQKPYATVTSNTIPVAVP